jgi:hypothetical protein
VTVSLSALLVHSAVTVVLPVQEGRDYVTYLRVYAELGSWRSVIPWEMLWRMPVAPALLGPPIDLGGPWAARIAAALAYAAVVTVWFRVALRFGARCAVAVALVLLATPSLVLLFHRYSSDAVAGVVFALVALALARLWERPTLARAAVLGVALVPMCLTRPAHQVLAPLALAPLLLAGTRRERLARAALCAGIVVCALGTWAMLNGLRYDDRALSRGGGAWLPFYRVYLTDGLIDPDRGPASRELAAVVAERLLTREPYVSYRIDAARFWGAPTTRYHEDLVGLTDRVYGWDERNAIMRRAALEAIRAHPGAFARGVLRSLGSQLVRGVVISIPREVPSAETIPVGGQTLPRPGEGGAIPAASFSYWLSRPDNAFDEVWTSPTEHHVVSTDPELLDRLQALERRVGGLHLPLSHQGSDGAARWLSRASRWAPPALLWLVVGCVAVARRRPARAGLALALAGSAVAALLATVLSVPPLPEFGAPFLPAAVVLGLAGLLGARVSLHAQA